MFFDAVNCMFFFMQLTAKLQFKTAFFFECIVHYILFFTFSNNYYHMENSAPVERSFNKCGQALRDSRNRLDPEVVSDLVRAATLGATL